MSASLGASRVAVVGFPGRYYLGSGTGVRAAVGFENVLGGSGDDTLVGSNDPNKIGGGPGDDRIQGRGGSDILQGGSGNDGLDGGAGSDLYYYAGSEPGQDVVTEAGSGRDADVVDFRNYDAGDGTGVRAAPAGAGFAAFPHHLDVVLSNPAGIEDFEGSAFPDVMIGGASAQQFHGNAGNDTLSGGLKNDVIDGGDGIDHLAETGNANFTLTTAGLKSPLGTATLTSVETASLTGGAGGNRLDASGFGGAVSLQGGGGADTLIGGPGDDSLAGGPGDDVYLLGLSASPQVDTVDEAAGAGSDRLDFTTLAAGDPVTADLTADHPLAFHANHVVNTALPGQAANFERVTGGAGNDSLTGNHADNTLAGGPGDDTYSFGDDWGRDKITELAGAGNDRLNFSAATAALSVNIGATASVQSSTTNTLSAGANIENLTGGGGDDIFAIANGKGVAGALDGGAGANTLDFSKYATRVTVNLRLGAATGTGRITNFRDVVSGSGNDLIVGDSGTNNLRGNAGRDILIGGDGLDVLRGDAGDDLLIAGGTSYDDMSNKLDELMAEWAGVGTYTLRINHLTGVTPNGVNGATVLTALTVSSDLFNDSLTGGAGTDWFIRFAGDDAIDAATGEQVTTF